MTPPTGFYDSGADFGQRLLERTVALKARMEADRRQLEQRILRLRQSAMMGGDAGGEISGRI